MEVSCFSLGYYYLDPHHYNFWSFAICHYYLPINLSLWFFVYLILTIFYVSYVPSPLSSVRDVQYFRARLRYRVGSATGGPLWADSLGWTSRGVEHGLQEDIFTFSKISVGIFALREEHTCWWPLSRNPQEVMRITKISHDKFLLQVANDALKKRLGWSG